MASIRLFGRGRNAVAASGAAVDAAQIADMLEGLASASMSTTWRCRHGAGVSIGEGAVDFAARRSRVTVIRGKYVFEYVRDGAAVLRAPVPDEDGQAPAAADSQDPDEDADDLDVDEDAGVELDAQDGGFDAEADLDELDAEADGDGAGEDAGEDEEEDEDGGAGAGTDAESSAEDDEGDGGQGGVSDAGADGRESAGGAGAAWQRFSEGDACGVHAYAEPSVLAAGVRAAGAVQPRGTQEFDGVALSAYTVTLKPKPADPNRLLARLARQLRDHGANVLTVTAFVDESWSGGSDDDAQPDAADGDGLDSGAAGSRIVRLRIELPHWTPADDPTADHTVSVDLYEFGEPVAIDMPDGAGASRRTQRSCADLALF